MKAKQLMFKFIVLCQSLSLLFTLTAMAEEPLTLWVHPYLPATELIKKFTPLADYLSEKCGKPIQVRVSESYKTHIERVGEERMDLAYLGPASYVKIFDTYGEKTLLARLEKNKKPFYHGVIVVRQDSPIKTLSDLTGKTFAFGDPNSTMSHLVPMYMLLEADITVDKFKKTAFLGTHNNVALGVLGGYYDAGGLKENVYFKYRERGLKLLAQSSPVSEHLFVARKDLPQATIAILRQSMLQLKDETILASIKNTITGLGSVKKDDYDYLFSVIRQLNKLKPE